MGIELTTSGFYALEFREKADSSKMRSIRRHLTKLVVETFDENLQ
jgi:hypothetical protein